MEMNRLIDTGLTGNKNLEIIDSVLGQLSDGMWENSRCMEKYWNNITAVIDEDDEKERVILKLNERSVYETYTMEYNRYAQKYMKKIQYLENGFYHMTDEKVKDWIATKAKQIVKQEEKDEHGKNWWKRDNVERDLAYIGYKKQITPADVYNAYDILKGRNTK